MFHASVMAAALSLASAGAQAAGLGKITVFSQLGQPLRAELEVTASREELGSLSARVAPHDAFKQVGVEFAPILTAVRFAVDKRPDGRAIIRMTTERPVNDPFLDVLVELTWTSGRMVREYTVLLDPPAEVQRAPVAVTPLPVTRVPPVAVTPPPAAAEPAAPAPGMPATAAPAASAGEREVKAGDTLAKIARETRPEGVSLDQMLVALFRGNPDAFAGKNMNRLKTGRILSIPDAVAVAEIPAQEARQIIVSQAADFNAYRQRLAATVAAAPVPEEAPKQEAVGKIAPKVEEKVPAPAVGTDKLQVSRTETQKAAADKQLQGRVTALEEDLVARERSLKEANSRIAELEKNIADMKKLAELKSQAGAQMQKQAEAVKAPEPAKTPEPAKAPAAKVPEPVPTPAAEPAKAEAPAEKPAPAAEAKPAAKPQPPKKPAAPPPPPPPEPSFLEENAMLVYGGGGVLALLLGYLGFNTWKRKREAVAGGPTTSRISEGDLTANSVFGTTGGQAVDTGASIQTDFSQSSLGAIDADEGVDPVAEADVYMAYGRDAQAEEILIDALKNDPARHAIHLKLLEIYAARKSLKQFEELATDLQGQTGGTGPNWEKAAALGRSVDPENPLYGGTGAVAEGLSPLPELASTTVILPPAGPVAEPAAETPAEKLQDTVTLPGQLAQMAAASEAPAPDQDAELDFDLGVEPPPAVEAEAPAIDTTALDFDLDLGAPAAELPPPAQAELHPDDMTHLTLDLASPELADMGEASEPTHINVEAPSAAPAPAEPSLDFEFDLGLEEAPAAGVPPVAPAPAPALDLDLTSADLELGTMVEAPEVAEGEDNPDVATKLELAQAYEEMGDKEGARELLQEVVNEGSPRQQETARSKLAALDA